MIINRTNRFEKSELLIDETIFSNANGYIGVRGSFTEGYGTEYEYNQTLINGFYDFYEYSYEENNKHFPQRGQKIVNVYNGQNVKWLLNGKEINLSTCKVISMDRNYLISKGYTTRKIIYETEEGFVFEFYEEKFVSQSLNNVIAIKIQLKSSNYTGPLLLKSGLNESVKKSNSNDPRLSNHSLRLELIEVNESTILSKTKKSGLHLASSVVHDKEFTYKNDEFVNGELEIMFDKEYSITKFIVHTTDLYEQKYLKVHNETIEKLKKIRFEDLRKQQIDLTSEFIGKQSIKMDDEITEETLNYCLYQLNNSGGYSEIHNIAAKGLSGEGYEGHYFWDTEIYLVPYYSLTNPSKARNLLLNRYRQLKYAKANAISLGSDKGVKFAWRSIIGEEASPYYPSGSAQFHINSDIAYAIIKYYQLTNDFEFMKEFGFEILVESARFLVSFTNYNDKSYHINSVTGPDEYTTMVDDNYYTNRMFKYHLEFLLKYYNDYSDDFENIIQKVKLTSSEIIKMKDIFENIYICKPNKEDIIEQDNRFFKREKLDLSKLNTEDFPLLLNFHPTFLYRYQVNKQPDTLLALLLENYSDMNVLKKNIDYYKGITTHDSSLSKCIFSILYFKVGEINKAIELFKEVLEIDLENKQGNTADGLHLANCGGAYLVIVHGILGLEIHDDFITFKPVIDKRLSGLELSVSYLGKKIKFEIHEEVVVTLEKGLKIIKDDKITIRGN